MAFWTIGRITAITAIGEPLSVIAIAGVSGTGRGTASVADLRKDGVVVAGNGHCSTVLCGKDQRDIVRAVAVIGSGHDGDVALDMVLHDRGIAAVAAIGDFGLAGSIGDTVRIVI